jgi:EpsI family protein
MRYLEAKRGFCLRRLSGTLRFFMAFSIMLVTAILLQARGKNEVFPSRVPLSQLPHDVGGWSATDIPIGQEERDVLGPGDFLLRVYQNKQMLEPYVDLFIAYFPTQRAGDTIHSPKNCLPGAGWSPIQNGRVQLSLPGIRPFNANRYIIAKGSDRQMVLYWYLAHDRAVASEYWAKIYLVTDAMRMNRSDGSLIRITTPLLPGEDPNLAQNRLVSFASLVVPGIDKYIPR